MMLFTCSFSLLSPNLFPFSSLSKLFFSSLLFKGHSFSIHYHPTFPSSSTSLHYACLPITTTNPTLSLSLSLSFIHTQTPNLQDSQISNCFIYIYIINLGNESDQSHTKASHSLPIYSLLGLSFFFVHFICNNGNKKTNHSVKILVILLFFWHEYRFLRVSPSFAQP